MQPILDQLKKVKAASFTLAELEGGRSNQILQAIANELRESSKLIVEENAKDLAKMSEGNPLYDRLLLSASRIEAIARDIEAVLALSSPLGKKFDERVMPNGLKIEKVVVPLGVVAVIYESRPNVTIDVFTLCFKTRNACVLKGGKEALYTNKILVKIIQEVLAAFGVNPDILYLLTADREASLDVLHAVGLIDVCIPRGSQALINFVRENAKIPVIETGAGIVHAYFDESGDLEKGRRIINNSKTRRVSVCNALDCLIIHEARLQDLFSLVELLLPNQVEIFADAKSYNALTHYPSNLLHEARPEHFGQEFLSYKLAIKTVASAEEAIQHIRQHTSGHSESIVAENEAVISDFLKKIDAAAVYANAPTSFTDGGQFGLGAEIGISTQKLHARGPMGLEALTSYKWLIYGDGQIRN